jgi:hypothetical protein
MKKTALVFFVSLTFISCYTPRYVYSPPTQNIPLLNKKNDLEVAAYYAGSVNTFKTKDNYNQGFDIQSAWAASNHFAIMLNESARWERNSGNDSYFPGDSSLLSYRQNFIEIGAGYYSNPKNNQKMLLQIFGGAAIGTSKFTDDFVANSTQTNKYHNSNVTKIFIQPAVLYSPLKNFLTTLSSRFTAVIFTRIHSNYTASELDNYNLDSLSVSPVYFWEPAVSYTIGFKKVPVKFRIQGSLSILLNHRFVEHRSSNIGFGIVSDFSRKEKNKTATPKN